MCERCVCVMSCGVYGQVLAVRAMEGQDTARHAVGGCMGVMMGLIWNGVGVIKGLCELGVAMGGAHVVEWDVGRHAGSNSGGEGPNLLMDVIQERVGGPAAMLFDDDAVDTVEFHGHGATST